MKLPFNLHPKVTAAAVVTAVAAVIVFVTNGLGLQLTATQWIVLDGAIAGITGYLIPTGTWTPSVPAAPVPPPLAPPKL